MTTPAENTPPAQNTPPVVVGTTNPPEEKFSREYVTELREENKNYRIKAKENEELAAKAKAEAEEKVKATMDAANQRIIKSELKAIALKYGIVDLDGLKLADLSNIKLNDNGEIEGGEDVIKALKEQKPYLFKEPTTTQTTQTPPPPNTKPKKATEMTLAEYEAEKRRLTGGK